MAGSLSAEAVAGYRARGFHFPVPLLEPAEAARRLAWVDDVRAGDPHRAQKLDLKANLLVPWIDALIRRPALVDAVESLLGPDILCWNANFRFKQPDGRAHAGWHQDTRYIRIKPSGVIALLALSPCTPDSGCLRVVPGSHDWPVLAHRDTENPDSILTRGQYITDSFDDSAAQDMVLAPGEVGLFDHNLVHSSGPNSTDGWRTILLAGFFKTGAVPETARRLTATLVRGTDRHHHFDSEERPSAPFAPRALAAHEAGARAMAEAMLYRGSARRTIAVD